MAVNGVAASGAAVTANEITKVRNSRTFGTPNCIMVLASTSGATVNAADNMFANCGRCVLVVNAAASGAIITATDNRFYNNGAAFAVAAGGVFLSGGGNKVAPVASAGPAPTGTL